MDRPETGAIWFCLKCKAWIKKDNQLKIAIVGAGISGLTCAYYLAQKHQVTVYESEAEIGGHTATKTVEVPGESHDGESHDIDTGFIVYNDWTYPNFIKLMNEIGVSGRASEMSFSVSCESSGLEYAGSNINTLFADRKNLLRPTYWKMLNDIIGFNKIAIADLESNNIHPDISLGDYLAQKSFGKMFREKYLVPMGAAIWSSLCFLFGFSGTMVCYLLRIVPSGTR